jgi:ribosome maturation protein Sdo1
VELFKIFVSTGRHGSQGNFDEASKGTLQNNFETENRDEIIQKIVLQGEIKPTKGEIVSVREPSTVRGNPT